MLVAINGYITGRYPEGISSALLGGVKMDKLLWYVKQLLPLKYRTIYGEGGKWYICEWRMWFGRCFSIKTGEVIR